MTNSIVILGAGYGGIMTAIKLESKIKSRDDVEILLVDRNAYHQYLHLSYEIVTNVKKVSDLTLPLSEIISNRKIRFLQTTVMRIDLHNKVVITEKGEIPYDELVIALGSEPNFCNINGAKEFALTLTSVESAAGIRDRLKQFFIENKSPGIVVGGGGFTGVELAGEILDEYKCCVTIIEGADDLLPSWNNPELSKKVANVLVEMGGKLLLGKYIVKVTPDYIILNDGSHIESSMFIWTGGVQASNLLVKSGLKTGQSNRVLINKFCEAVDFPGVYVVGDSALVNDPIKGDVLPQCIEIALQQAEVAAKNLFADLQGAQKTVYAPKFGGLILAVGETYGIGKIFGVTVEGRVAQMVKRLIHLQYVYEIAGLRGAIKESL